MNAQTITLNLNPGGMVPPRVNLSQYDSILPTIEITLYDGTATYTIPNDAVVYVTGTKADKTGFEYACSFSGSTVTVIVTEQMTAFPGIVPCELVIYVGDERKGTANFQLAVEPAALADDTVISETDIPIIQHIPEIIADMEESVEDAEAWAVGERGGVPVESGDETYHNNAEYWARVAAQTLAGERLFYGTCSTSSGTAEKVVTTEDGNMDITGKSALIVYFLNSDTSTSPTMNVDGTGAKPIFNEGVAIAADVIEAGHTYLFVYDGTNYELVGGGSAGHVILDEDGVAMAKRRSLSFGNAEVTDDSTNNVTKVDVRNIVRISQSDYNALSTAEKNSGVPYYVYDATDFGGAYVFQTVTAMNAAISGGTVPSGAICMVEEDTPYKVTALDTTYDNSTSGLTATTVQAAIDELKALIGA